MVPDRADENDQNSERESRQIRIANNQLITINRSVVTGAVMLDGA